MAKKTIDGIGLVHFNKDFERVDPDSKEVDRIRLSVFCDGSTRNSHHIEFPPSIERFQLSGLLINLAHRIAKDRH